MQCKLQLCSCVVILVKLWPRIKYVLQHIPLRGFAALNAAFTPDTCSPDTSCIHLYPLLSLVAVLHRRQNCRHGYMYPSTCIYRHVDGYKLLVRDTSCIRLHPVSGNGISAALVAIQHATFWHCNIMIDVPRRLLKRENTRSTLTRASSTSSWTRSTPVRFSLCFKHSSATDRGDAVSCSASSSARMNSCQPEIIILRSQRVICKCMELFASSGWF